MELKKFASLNKKVTNILNLKKQLLEEYKYRIELHAHSFPSSRCSEVSPEELIEIYSGLEYDAIVLTNHFMYNYPDKLKKEEILDKYIESFEKAKKTGKKFGLNVLFGAEIRFTENHNDYLIYGVDRNVLSVCYDYFKKGVKAFRQEVKLDKSVFIQAHPFRNAIEFCDPELLDGMETFNMHPGHNSRIGLAVKYADENNIKIKTAGSDFHHKNRSHEGVAAMRTKVMPMDSFQLAEILKTGDYILEIGKDSLVLP